MTAQAPAPLYPTRLSVAPEEYVRFSDKLTDSLDDITGMINKHKGMIDAIQDVGIHLTDAFGTLHTLTVKYAGVVNSVLDALLPWLKRIPLVPPQMLTTATRMEAITQQIIDNGPSTARAIIAVNTGLKQGDVIGLRDQSVELEKVTKTLAAILPGK